MIKLVVAVILLVVIFFLLKIKRSEVEDFPYKKRRSLLTSAEREFYEVLKKSVEDLQQVLLCKVRILDLVEPTRKGYVYINKISAKHIDFVLCRESDMRPTLAIELDDSSHGKRKERDNFVNEVMNVSKLKLVRFKVEANYDLGNVRSILKSCLSVDEKKY